MTMTKKMCKFRNIAPKVAKIAKAVNKADGKTFEVTDVALDSTQRYHIPALFLSHCL